MKKRLLVVFSLVMILFIFTGCKVKNSFTISGRVTDFDGNSMAGVDILVQVEPNGQNTSGPYDIKTTTNDAGMWQAVVPPSIVIAYAEKDQWLFSSENGEVASNETRLDFIGVKEGPVHFPDANLEAAVRSEIEKPTGEIMVSDVIDESVFSAPNRQISSLEGMEYFFSAYFLNFSNNQITDISPLVKLKTNLEELYLSQNPVENMELLKDTHLCELYYANNQISDINFLENFTYIDTLNLENNQISDINVLANLHNLIQLNLNANKVSDISALANLPKLVRLEMNANQITDISSLANLNKLKYVYLNANQISDISVLLDLPDLVDVSVKDNPTLNTAEGSPAYEVIQQLKARNVTVNY